METTYDWTGESYSELEKTDPQYGRFFSIVKELNEADDKAVLRRLRTEMVLEWREEYNVGVQEIDLQHKLFFEIIRKIFVLHIQGIGHAHTDELVQLNPLLDELLECAEFHFQTEEQLMARHGYPMMHTQLKEHEIIMSELNRQVKAIRSSHGSTAKLVYFLVQWFIKHTVYSHRDIGMSGIRQRPARAFRFNLKGAVQKVTAFLNQPLRAGNVIEFLNQPLPTIWGGKNGSAYPVG
ncbi:MAG: hemerythrin family protein [Candidatus Electrothrix sp. Rat3]|nr:hemerythrin family protein [Candidatus Electrothrix rattekaaiensis]